MGEAHRDARAAARVSGLGATMSVAGLDLAGRFPGRWSWEVALRIVAWTIVLAAFINVLLFVVGTANPVMRSDDWYFFDVFVRKAIDGTLGIGDFFVKRFGADHAQPLSKLVLWFEWRYLDLDVAFESIVGVLAAFALGLILRRFVMASRGHDGRDGWNAVRQLAWGTMCVLLFSLNSSGIWTWPLVALNYLTLVPALLFVWAAWHALRSRRLGVLAVATIVLAVIDDDNAIILVGVVVVGLLWVLWRDPRLRQRGAWQLFVVVVACLVVVRIGYGFAPVVGGAPSSPFATYVSRLAVVAERGGWWKWIIQPLAFSVAYDNPFRAIPAGAWAGIQLTVGALLVVAHGAFWWRALRRKHTLTTFAAVCLMLLAYAWLAGVLVYRVSSHGTSYLHQARYVQLYAFNLIALLLMWAGPIADRRRRRWLAITIPATGCVLLLALQVPLAMSAWQFRPYLLKYYRQAAMQLEMVANYPRYDGQCLPILPVCTWQPAHRADALQMLRSHELNVFSPHVQVWHPYLPRTAVPTAQDTAAIH